MKTLIVTTALLISLKSYSQWFIGFTEEQVTSKVKKIYKNARVTKSIFMNKVNLSWNGDRMRQTVVFENGYSHFSYIECSTQQKLNEYLDGFNKNYVKRDDKTWTSYINGRPYDIRITKRIYYKPEWIEITRGD